MITDYAICNSIMYDMIKNGNGTESKYFLSIGYGIMY